MRRVVGVLPALVLLAAPLARARETTEVQLDRAIQLFNNFEDQRAESSLAELLQRRPPSGQAARARVYLGLIALNALKSDAARAEFKAALAIEPTTELPFDASPKARLVFEQVRQEFVVDVMGTSSAGGAPSSRHGDTALAGTERKFTDASPPSSGLPTLEVPPRSTTPSVPRSALQAAAPSGPDHVPAYVVGGLGVAALAAGIVVGVVANATLSQAAAATDVGSSQSLAAQAGAQGATADVFLVAGGVGVVAAVVLFVIESNGGGQPSDHVRAEAHGLALTF